MKKIITILVLALFSLQAECIDYNNMKLNIKTNLMWSAQATLNQSWTNANTYCSGLSQGGFIDWVLPNINQLESERVNEGESAVCFTPNGNWSSTPKTSTDNFIMQSNNVYFAPKTDLKKVRCVRLNQ